MQWFWLPHCQFSIPLQRHTIWPFLWCIFHSSLDMHNAAHTMRISDIVTSAWLIDFCHKATEPWGLRSLSRDFMEDIRISLRNTIGQSMQWWTIHFQDNIYLRGTSFTWICHLDLSRLRLIASLWQVSCIRQTKLAQSGAPGHVIGWTNFSHWHSIHWFCQFFILFWFLFDISTANMQSSNHTITFLEFSKFSEKL